MIAQRRATYKVHFRALYRPDLPEWTHRNSGAASDKTTILADKSTIYFESSYLTLTQ